MIAAWIMLGADALFAARPVLPPAVGRIAPTLLVTLGQAALLLGSRVAANEKPAKRLAVFFVVLHGVLLTTFFHLAPDSIGRRVSNGLIWATLAFLSYRALRRSPAVFWKSITAPANAFMAHAVFHLVRLGFALLPAANEPGARQITVEIMGDLEVSFFMVALFVGLLVSHLQRRNEQLSSALAEVKTLSGLLPICAWCKKVRDDDGYWQQVEDYFRNHSDITFSHGMCSDCAEDFKKETTKL
jgi:hypothetical protein